MPSGWMRLCRRVVLQNYVPRKYSARHLKAMVYAHCSILLLLQVTSWANFAQSSCNLPSMGTASVKNFFLCLVSLGQSPPENILVNHFFALHMFASVEIGKERGSAAYSDCFNTISFLISMVIS